MFTILVLFHDEIQQFFAKTVPEAVEQYNFIRLLVGDSAKVAKASPEQ
jgi:hypothetical protein